MTEHVDSEAEIRRRVEQRLKKRGEFYIHLTVYVAVNLALWVVWLLMGSVFPWPLVLSLGWGAGLIGHGIDVYYTSGGRDTRREQVIHDTLRRIYGEDWRASATQEDYTRIRKEIEKDFNKRKEFLIHLGTYIPINLLLWLVWFLTNEVFDFPWPLVLSLGWGVGLVIHAIDVYFATGSRLAAREAAIQREIERERERLYAEKPKRSRLVIADDGELMEVVEDEWEDRSKAKRR